jgi:predicted nucleotidyltransferase
VEKILEKRRESTNQRFEELRAGLYDAAARIDGKACAYATGSFARGEAGQFSDLDLFIVGLGNRAQRSLNRLDEICLKADLIRVTRELGIPEFSGDGAYLSHFTVDELIEGLGKPEDDATNTFTARLLLLLESRPLLGEEVYNGVIAQVVSAYWRDYEDHKSAFMPAFLTNDILRLWRTFCVNYEARTATEPAKEKAKRKLKNFKLKHSRLLTCYSGLLYLLSLYRRKGTVTPKDAIDMVKLSPTQRLAWLKVEEQSSDVSELVDALLQKYETFLGTTDDAGEKLVLTFMDKSQSRNLLNSAYDFGDKVFDLMEVVGTEASGTKNRFYRLLVV